MTIAFYELRLLGITRYARRLAEEIRTLDPGQSLAFFYDQADDLKEDEVLRQLPPGSRLKRVSTVTFAAIRSMLVESRCKTLVVMAQRIPDSAVVSVAKTLGVRTVMFQHGMYIPFMKREPGMFLAQAAKTLRYLRYARVIANASGRSSLRSVADYIKVHVAGRSVRTTDIDVSKVNVDKVLVYGEYWKEYHRDVFGYALESQEVVGCPDLDHMNDIDAVDPSKLSADITYVAQSLVEDGRLSRATMVEFINVLCDVARSRGCKVLVKLHPRTDKTMYTGNEDVVEFFDAQLPVSRVVVGHYSSLLAKYTFVTDKIILWQFPGHAIPPYYANVASVVVSDAGLLKTVLCIAPAQEIDSGKVLANIRQQSRYFLRADAVAAAAQLILA